MEYDELMKALGKNLGLDGLEPDKNGIYSFSIDDTVVSFDNVLDSGQLDIVAKVCDLPAEGGEQLYKILLTAMAPGSAAETYTFFITSDDQCVYMRRTGVLDRLDVESLYQLLEKFVNALDEWRSSISSFRELLPDINEALENQLDETRSFGLKVEGVMQV